MPTEPIVRAIATDVGIVVIGRNEGQRLVGCLASVRNKVQHIVYVDSGSTDGSPAGAERSGATVVRLDMAHPFTAARGRNAGFAQLKAIAPNIRYIQFVDGDCEIVPGWLDTAFAFLERHDDVAVACGRRRERYPERSVYNRLCDIEWDTPVGQAAACGGDAMMRVAAFAMVGGFRAELVAGEEPELCARMRQAGWKIWRIDAEMTRHDAAMLRFSQWWRRCVRSGQSEAEYCWIYAQFCTPAREKKAVLSAVAWAGVLPPLIGAGAFFHPVAFAGLLLYPLQVFRIAWRRGLKTPDSGSYAFFMILGKFAQMRGILTFFWRRWRGQALRLIEYK